MIYSNMLDYLKWLELKYMLEVSQTFWSALPWRYVGSRHFQHIQINKVYYISIDLERAWFSQWTYITAWYSILHDHVGWVIIILTRCFLGLPGWFSYHKLQLCARQSLFTSGADDLWLTLRSLIKILQLISTNRKLLFVKSVSWYYPEISSGFAEPVSPSKPLPIYSPGIVVFIIKYGVVYYMGYVSFDIPLGVMPTSMPPRYVCGDQLGTQWGTSHGFDVKSSWQIFSYSF